MDIEDSCGRRTIPPVTMDSAPAEREGGKIVSIFEEHTQVSVRSLRPEATPSPRARSTTRA